MLPVNKKKCNRLIQLVISNGKSLLENTREDNFPDKSVQLELFSNSKRNAFFIIFVQPNDFNFRFIIDEIKKDNIKTVLDIRESPFLNFKHTSRDFFLNHLDQSSTEYLNVHKWMRNLHAETVKEFFLKMEMEKDSRVNIAKSSLMDTVKRGPLVVFSDVSPEKDELVSQFQKELMQSNIEYSAHFMS